MTNEHTEFKDWLSEVITDSLDMDWSSSVGARLIVERLDEQPVYDAAHDLLEALKGIVEEKADYMRLNNLGDPEEQHTVKQARAAINRAEGRS